MKICLNSNEKLVFMWMFVLANVYGNFREIESVLLILLTVHKLFAQPMYVCMCVDCFFFFFCLFVSLPFKVNSIKQCFKHV